MTAPVVYSDRAAFEHLLQQVLHDDQDGSFGRLHIVRISPVGADDDEWHRLLPKAMAIAENILHHRLGATDSCLRLAEGRFMLLFPTLSAIEGRLRATAIATEIRQHLTGNQSHGVEVATEVLPLSTLRHTKAPASVETMHKAMEHSHHPSISLSIEYQPVWDMPRQAIIGSRARAGRDFGGQTMWERAVMFGGEEDPMAVDVNRHLAHAGAAFRPDRGLLFLPVVVNTHTLSHGKGIEDFLDTICHPGGGKLVLELAGAVANLSRPTLRAVIGAIRARGCAVAIRVVPEAETARFLRECGAEYLCLNQLQAQLAGFTPSAIHALYTLVAHDVGELGFQLALWNATNPEDIKRAASLGFTLFSGAPVGVTTKSAATLKTLPVPAIFA